MLNHAEIESIKSQLRDELREEFREMISRSITAQVTGATGRIIKKLERQATVAK